jgi:hypothetical protein
VDEILLRTASLVTTYLVLQVFFENLLVIRYSGGRFKFRFHTGQLNPFISHNKAILLKIVEILLTVHLSGYVENFFVSVLSSNTQYRYPIFVGTVLSAYIVIMRDLNIKMNKERGIIFLTLLALFIISLKWAGAI